MLRFYRFGLSKPRQKSVAPSAMFFDALADVLSSDECLSFAHRAHDPGASGSPTGFSVPQFSKRCRKKSITENRPPRKGCKQPDLACARGAPFVRQ